MYKGSWFWSTCSHFLLVALIFCTKKILLIEMILNIRVNIEKLNNKFYFDDFVTCLHNKLELQQCYCLKGKWTFRMQGREFFESKESKQSICYNQWKFQKYSKLSRSIFGNEWKKHNLSFNEFVEGNPAAFAIAVFTTCICSCTSG